MRITIVCLFGVLPLLAEAKLMVVFASGNPQVIANGQSLPLRRGSEIQSNSLIKANSGMVQLRRADGSLLAVRRFEEYLVNHSDVSAARVGGGLVDKDGQSQSVIKGLLRQVTNKERRASRTTVPEVLLAEGDTTGLDTVSAVTAGISGGDSTQGEEDDPEQNPVGPNPMTQLLEHRYAGSSSGRYLVGEFFTLVDFPSVASVNKLEPDELSHIEQVFYSGGVTNDEGDTVFPAGFAASSLANATTSPGTQITWGRWDEGLADIDTPTMFYQRPFSESPLHAVASAAIDESLPATLQGVVAFELIGSTAPTDQQGLEGVLGNAELTVDFIEAEVDASVELTLDSHSWAASGSAPLTQDQLFSGDFDEVVRDGVTGYDGEFHGFVQDKGQVIGGATHSGAAFAYQLEGAQTTVSGVAVFKEP